MPKANGPKFRVLCFDGSSASGGTGYVAVGMLEQIDSLLRAGGQNESLLDAADVFAGTSAGAANAVLFAMHDNPHDALEGAIDFWKGMLEMSKSGMTVRREISALLGQAALVSTVPMQKYLISHFGATTTMGDLKRKVIIPTFQLDNERKGDQRTWKPKIYKNFDENEHDRDELVVDVVMRSGSPPVLTPIYQGLDKKGPGFVDGGIYANNPSMIAIAQMYRELRKDTNREHDLLVLSLGNGDAPNYLAPEFEGGFGDWGYAPWFLKLSNLGIGMYMILESGLMAIDYECHILLGESYRRVDPHLPHELSLHSGVEIPEVLESVLSLPECRRQIREAADWLNRKGWFSKHEVGVVASKKAS